jgi:hypothetical protein
MPYFPNPNLVVEVSSDAELDDGGDEEQEEAADASAGEAVGHTLDLRDGGEHVVHAGGKGEPVDV